MPPPSWNELAGKGDQQDYYEDRAVRNLCTCLGRTDLIATVQRESRQRTGPGLLSFPLFEELTGFHVRLRTSKVRGVRWLSVPDLFNRFPSTQLGKALRAIHDELDAADGPIGLVFRWTGDKDSQGKTHAIKDGRYMVLHTFEGSTHDSVQVVVPVTFGKRQYVATLETMRSFAISFHGYEHNNSDYR
jgi:hypothetical protein